jgi:hypothetical protein
LPSNQGQTTATPSGRFGDRDWVLRSGGRLGPVDSIRLSAAFLISAFMSLPGLAALRFWIPIRPKVFSPPALPNLNPALVRCVEKEPSDEPIELLEHSYRTWLFGLALARADGHLGLLDPDLFYCGSLLHDHGLARPVDGRDFTMESSDRAMECALAAGLTSIQAKEIGDAICLHATPGISVNRDGPLAFYIQAGSIADAWATRLWDFKDSVVQQIIRQHDRSNFKDELIRLMRREAWHVPHGRFALLVRLGGTRFIWRSIHGIR